MYMTINDAMGYMVFSKLVPQFLKHVIPIIVASMMNNTYFIHDLHIWYNVMLLGDPHSMHSPLLSRLSQPNISQQMQNEFSNQLSFEDTIG